MKKRIGMGRLVLAGLVLIVGAAVQAADPAPEAEAESARKQDKPLRILCLGSSSTGKLRGMLTRDWKLFGEDGLHWKGGDFYFCIPHMCKWLEAGDEKRYQEDIAKCKANAHREGEEYDVVFFQILGSVAARKGADKHVPRILDDVCETLKKEGRRIVIWHQGWSPRLEKPLLKWTLEAARRNGVEVAFGGAATQAVYEDKGANKAAHDYLNARTLEGRGKIGWRRGDYVTSCAVYAALTGKSCVGLPHPKPKLGDDGKPLDPTVTEEDILYMQKMAWESQQKYSKLLEMPVKEKVVEKPAAPDAK